MQGNSTAPANPGKPVKPFPEYPLTPHPSGRWCKKIKGRLVYFGPWDDPDGALKRYREFAANAGTTVVKKLSKRLSKVKKPHKDFPLTPHPSGRWCKKIRGRLVYFGKIIANDNGASAQAALDKWLNEKDDLLAGRVPRSRQDGGIILDELIGRFLDAKKAKRDAGELSPHTWQMYFECCRELVATFTKHRLLSDIRPDDFTKLRERWSAKWGAERIAAEINRARTVFNWAFKGELIDKPIRFGPEFVKPSKKTRRLNRAEQGVKMFEAAELRTMIDAATQPLKSMLLLAINAGMGNNDLAQMPIDAIDAETGWLDYPRPKTGIMRRCPLWPETITALSEWFEQRPAPKTEGVAALLFLTVRGDGWATNIKDRPITHQTRKLLDKLKIDGKRNFYSIRHTFETVAGGSRDQIGVDAIMGHDDGSMGNVYRERIGDERLQAVAEHVRQWLFAKLEGDEEETPRLRIMTEPHVQAGKEGAA